MPNITWKSRLMWILFVIVWLFMIIIPFLPCSFCQPEVDFSWLRWSDTTVINCVHSLVFTVHRIFFFTRQLHNASWLHGVDVILLSWPLYILAIFWIQLLVTFTVFLLKILCSLWDFGKCLLNNRRKSFATFVDTTLLNGRLNQAVFLDLFLVFVVDFWCV